MAKFDWHGLGEHYRPLVYWATRLKIHAAAILWHPGWLRRHPKLLEDRRGE